MLTEDHDFVREALRLLIQLEKDLAICAEAKTGREAVQKARDLRPDVILMDIAMPILNGIQATKQILRDRPKVRIIILSAHADPEYIHQVMAAGVAGYLTKQTSGEGIAQAIREVHGGKTYFSPSVAKQLGNSFPGDGMKSAALTRREAELLQLIAEGHGNKQIAALLNISIKTVEKHRQHLMEKLNIHEIAGLTRYAIAAGVIESSIQQTTRLSH